MKQLLMYGRLACFLCILLVTLNATSTGLAFMHGQPANEVGSVQDPYASSMEPGETAWIILLDGDPVSVFRQRFSAGINGLNQAQKNQVTAYDQQITAAQHGLIQAARQQGMQVTTRRSFRYLLNGLAVSTDARNVDRLSTLPGVKGIYPDSLVHIELAESVSLIGADQVWQMHDSGGQAVTGQGMRVAVIDTGIDYTHPDLGGCFGPSCKVAGGYDLYNNDANPIDDNGHGTHCAGIVAANGTVKGVAPGASLYAYKVLNSSGSGSISVIIAGIERAADPDQDPTTADAVDVISMSLGLTGTPDDPWPLAVDAAVEQGIFVAVSAGNSGPNYYTVESPGLARRATSVGASDKTDLIASFSSRGPVPGYDDWLKPNLLAPGVDIVSTYLGGAYATSSGTSMAAPHVAGAAALVRQMHPTWNPDQVQSSLMNTAVDLGYNVHTQGAGRVQVNQAVIAAGLVTPASVSFGTVDPSQPLWSDTRLLWLENSTSSERSYSLSVEASLPAGVTVSVYPTTITLVPGAKRSFSVVLAVDTLQTPPDLERNEGSIHIQQGGQLLTVPFAFMMQPVFIENRLLPFGLQTSYSVALEDLDGDGDLDAFVGNTSYYDNPANTVWFNDGNGNFTDSGQRLGSVFTWDVALGDLDGDGDLDAFAANSEPTSARPDEVWLNNGHGIFTDSGQRLGSTLSRAVALGDLDGDGDLDAFVANGVSDRGQPEADRVWLNNGQGIFSDSGQQLGNAAGLDVALGDLDGDGDLDAFIANGDPLRILNDPSEVWVNNGHAVFSNSGQNIGNAISQAVALGDLDSDGDLDAFIANGGPNVLDGQPDEVWWNTGGQFTNSGQSLGKQSSYGAALADIHKDGTLDVVVAGYQGGNTLWINDGEGNLTLSSPAFIAENSTDVALGDVDDDGDIDALFANGMSKPNRLWLNRGSGGSTLDPLIPPSNLTATGLSTTSIALSWSENAIGETSYRVERSPDGSTGWLETAILPAGSSSFTDTTVSCGQSYYYRVRAYRADTGIYSAYSNIASASTWQCGTGNPEALVTSDIGQNQIRLSWQDNATDESEYRVERSPNGSTSWTEIAILPANTSSYLDSGLACGTTYFYRVRAYRAVDGEFSLYSNIASATTSLCAVLPPSNLIANSSSQTQINLTWDDNAVDETDYRIERSTDGTTNWVLLNVLPAGAESYNNTNLTCNTLYFYRVRAFREIDDQYSAYSNTTSAATSLCNLLPPSGLTTTGISQTQIDLSWLDNATDETEYQLERSPNGSTGWILTASLPQGSNSYSSTNLTCGTPYFYRVRAYRAVDGQFSAYSNILSTSTKLCDVIPPGNLIATPVSQTSIYLSWQDLALDESGYRVERSANGGTSWTEIAVLGAGSVNYSDTALTCSTSYAYRVRAYRSIDNKFSIYSNIASSQTNLCDVTPPTNLLAASVSQTEIRLTWLDNAVDENEYRIERRIEGGTTWIELAVLPSGSVSYSDSSLTCGTHFYYRVRAYRLVDGQFSAYSNIADAPTYLCDVLAPSNLTATAQSQTQINLSWIDNAGDESEYRVERSPDGVSSWAQVIVLPAGSTSYTNSGLSCATQYSYRVRAYRAADGKFSAYSNIASAKTNACSVTAPDELSAVTVSQTQIHLSWQDRSVDETEFRVERSPDGLIGWIQQAVLPAGSENYDDSSLVCNTRYYYRVRAYRASDTQFSEYSNIANAQTKLCPVAAPGNLTAVAVSPSQISLTWQDQATDETDYRIERSPDGITSWSNLVVLPAESTSYTDTSAVCDTVYYYRARAYREVDQQFSAYSSVTNATSQLCGLTPPTGLSAIFISSTEIILTWDETDTGEIVYLIERSLESNAGWLQITALPVESKSYQDSSLMCSTRYFYRIRAHRPADDQYSNYSSVVELQTAECFTRVYIPCIIK